MCVSRMRSNGKCAATGAPTNLWGSEYTPPSQELGLVVRGVLGSSLWVARVTAP
jgi:hypothetical protein